MIKRATQAQKVGPTVLPELHLISRLQGSVTLEKGATLESGLSDIFSLQRSLPSGAQWRQTQQKLVSHVIETFFLCKVFAINI